MKIVLKIVQFQVAPDSENVYVLDTFGHLWMGSWDEDDEGEMKWTWQELSQH